MSKPISARASRPLRSADRCDLLIPWSRISLSQNRAFAVVGPALWNDTHPALRGVRPPGHDAFPPCFRIPPISEKFLRLPRKVSRFYLFRKNFRFSSAKISDDFFSHRPQISTPPISLLLL